MDGSSIKPEPQQPSASGPSKPKPAEEVGGDSHAQEGLMASDGESQGGGPQKASGIKDSMKDKVGAASGMMDDMKEVAKAGKTDAKSVGKEIKQGAEKDGIKGAAGAAAREAAGKAASAAAVKFSGGALKPIAGKIQKGVSKGLKKENLKKFAIGAVILLAIPTILFSVMFATLNAFAEDPFGFIKDIITDPKKREFTIEIVKGVGKVIWKTIFSSEEFYTKYGYVELKPGHALATSHNVIPPRPGYIEEKMLKINIKNARYQSRSAAPGCPYTYTTKDLINPTTGATTSVIDEIRNNSGEVVAGLNDSFMVRYCIIQSMPIYNMMVRTKKARDVNTFSNTALNYAETLDSPNIKGKTPTEVKKYVYNKTYNRITSKVNNPITNISKVDDYIKEVSLKLKEGDDPNSVQFDFGTDANTPAAIGKTLCAFTKGYLENDNIRLGILGRLNSGQRSAVKSNTLSSTRKLGLLSNEELSPTLKQLDGWAASRAYSQNVYGTQTGEAIDPERLGNTAYGASYRTSLALLYAINNKCADGLLSSEVGDVNKFYGALRQLIVDQSNGKFISIDGFGLQELMVGVIRMGGGSAVSGLEPGAQNFNNQSQGFRTLSNQYMMRMGGRFLTKEESMQLDLLAENTRREVENKNGLAYRLFAEDNIRSLANIIRYETPQTPTELGRKAKDYIASLSNPIKLLADLSSGFSQVVLGKSTVAYAADKTGDAYMRIDTVGLPTNELDNTDLIANSNYIQDLLATGSDDQKRVLGYFDMCSKANIPTKSIFTRLYDAEITEEGEVSVEGIRANLVPKDGPISYPAINNYFAALGITGDDGRTAFVACEIYLMPPEAHETTRDYGAAKQINLFGFQINELARQYHLYLYANSIVDLMVELSSTEKNDSIYAHGLTGSTPPPTPDTPPPTGDGGGGVCPDGTTDGGKQEGWSGGITQGLIQICWIGGNSKMDVNIRIAANVVAMINKARSDGIILAVNSGYRTYDEQVQLRKESCGTSNYDIYEKPSSQCDPPVARPGFSRHQMGLAVDLNYNGQLIRSNRSPGFWWLTAYAINYGLKNLPSETWHWSVDGH